MLKFPLKRISCPSNWGFCVGWLCSTSVGGWPLQWSLPSFWITTGRVCSWLQLVIQFSAPSRFGWTAELKVSSTFKAKTHPTQVWIQYALHSLVFVGTPREKLGLRFRSKELLFQTTLLYNPTWSIHLFLSQPLRFYLPKHISSMVKTCETCPQWGMVISP